jgi:peroxiredoxin
MNSGKTEKTLQALLVLLGLAFGWAVWDGLRNKVVEEGDRAPAFTLTTDSGRTVTPRQFGGKLLVLHFWATWCPTCVEEISALNQFHEQYAGAGVVVVGVSVDKNPQAYAKFLKRFGIRFETTRDAAAALASAYGTYQYPETYLINTDGRVVKKIISNADWTGEAMGKLVRSLL